MPKDEDKIDKDDGFIVYCEYDDLILFGCGEDEQHEIHKTKESCLETIEVHINEYYEGDDNIELDIIRESMKIYSLAEIH